MTPERLKEILVEASENEYSIEDINDNTDIIEDLSFDSITYLKAIVNIEEETGVDLDDEDIEEISVFSALLNSINSKL